MNDITISRLLARGESVEDSELKFSKGVNLITGGSDTGKSYAFDLINFLFGSKDEPHYIKERKGYSDFFVEIDVNGKAYTLLRRIDDIKIIYVYYCSINEIDEKTTFEEFRSSSQAVKSISSFLLDKLGLKEKLYFNQNKSNKLQQLTFRSYVKSFMISEEKITAKSTSIVETELKHPKETFTREKFAYFLTKKGFKQNKATKRKNQAQKNKIDILLEMKGEYEQNLNKLEKELCYSDNERVVEKEVLHKGLTEMRQIIEGVEGKIKEMSSQIEDMTKEVGKIEMQKNSNDLTIQRFQTLLKQYLVEMEKVDFMYQSENYLSQLETPTCPVCNTEIVNDYKKCEEIYIAYEAENRKISLKINDIRESINDIKERNAIVENYREKKLLEVSDIERDLNENQKPLYDSLINEYEEVLKINENFTKHNLYNEEIEKIEKKISLLDSGNKVENDANDDINIDTTLLVNRRNELCEEMSSLLEKFKFSDKVNVTYDEENIDFIVNKQSRKAYGQGYSSIVYVSFVLALKKIMDKYSIETPNFVILDSPFTSLTEGDEVKDKRVRVSSKIFDAFFEYCCKEYQDKQLIIFENTDEKYRNIDKRINYIHFSKNHNIGRYGFFIGKNKVS